MNQTLKNLIGALGLDIVSLGIVDGLRDHVRNEVGRALSSNGAGFGTNDEVLFQSACAYAVLNLNAEVAKVNKVISIINSYPIPERRRIVRIIGRSEQQISSPPVASKQAEKKEEPTKDGKKADKGGEKKEEKTTTTAPAAQIAYDNIRGGRVIFLLSKMEEPNIKEFLKVSGATDTFKNKINHLLTAGRKLIEPVIDLAAPVAQFAVDEVTTGVDDLQNDYHAILATPGPLARLADKIDIFHLFR